MLNLCCLHVQNVKIGRGASVPISRQQQCDFITDRLRQATAPQVLILPHSACESAWKLSDMGHHTLRPDNCSSSVRNCKHNHVSSTLTAPAITSNFRLQYSDVYYP